MAIIFSDVQPIFFTSTSLRQRGLERRYCINGGCNSLIYLVLRRF